MLPYEPKPIAVGDLGNRASFEIDQFNFISRIGHNGIGNIALVEHAPSTKLYAAKILAKEFTAENDDVYHIYTEKEVHQILNPQQHPFLDRLFGCFQTDAHIYFLTEFLAGGSLFDHLQRGPFGVRRSRLYAAEICMALDFLHKHGILHRNLTIENVFLASDGHVKLTDFYFCKRNMWHGSRTSTFCGTPHFFAPEVIIESEYGLSVDWFHFGCMLYQMLLHQQPFEGEDEDEIIDATLGSAAIYPASMHQDQVSILKQLLAPEPAHRLGSGPADAHEVMAHPFFKDIVWDDLYHKKVVAPFIPTIKGDKDLRNFHVEFTSDPKGLHSAYSTVPTTAENEFPGFDFTADFA